MALIVGKHSLPTDIPEKIEGLNNTECSKQVIDGLRHTLKKTYDHLYKENSLSELKSKALRKLLIDGFDSEQLFQQIDLQNKSAIDHFNKCISSIDSKYVGSINHKVIESSSSDEEEIELTQDKSSLSEQKEFIFDDDSDSSADYELPYHKPSLNKEFDLDVESGALDNISNPEAVNSKEDVGKSTKDKSKIKSQQKFKSVVDDQFFKLSSMAEFLRTEDIKAENDQDMLQEDEDEDIDYYQDMEGLSDDFDDDDDDLNDGSSKNIMYDDFFDPPASGDENINSGEEPADSEDEINDEEDDNFDGDDLSEVDENEPEKSLNLSSKTPFEAEQDKIKKTITDYEEKLIQKSEWHLTGEVAASSRPKNSLLHQDTDFDVNAKPVLIEDSDLLQKVEKAIISIIKNKAYSDGQRKVKPAVNFSTQKKEIVIEQNKSKKSLAQVYEEDYLKKKYGEQEQENPKHVEIKKMMDTVLPELQALFCHIPKPAIPDIKIVSNLPAVTVEEVAPTSISDATLLAPQEVKKNTGSIKGQTERTDSDRKRERRKKKLHQKMKFKKIEKEAANLNPLSSKAKKLDKLSTLKKLKQNRNTKELDMGEQKIKSSKDFFSRLQDSVNSEGKTKKKKII